MIFTKHTDVIVIVIPLSIVTIIQSDWQMNRHCFSHLRPFFARPFVAKPRRVCDLQGSKARNHKCQVELEPKSHVSPWPSSISQSFVEFANASYASMSQTHEMQRKTTRVNKKQKSSEIHQYETITIQSIYIYTCTYI